MIARLFLLFIIVPIVDLFLLIWIAKYTGIPVTIGLIVLTAAIGAWLVRLQGAEIRRQLLQQFSSGMNPAGLLTDGAMIMLAAGLLLTPGLLTDCFGFTLLTPLCRKFYKRGLTRWFKANVNVQVFTPEMQSRPSVDDDIIEGEVVSEAPAENDSQSEDPR